MTTLGACKLALALLDTIANQLGSVTQGTNCDTLKTRAMLEATIREAEQEQKALVLIAGYAGRGAMSNFLGAHTTCEQIQRIALTAIEEAKS